MLYREYFVINFYIFLSNTLTHTLAHMCSKEGPFFVDHIKRRGAHKWYWVRFKIEYVRKMAYWLFILCTHTLADLHWKEGPPPPFWSIISKDLVGINASMTSKYQARSTCEVFFFKYLFADCIHLTQLNFINFCHKMWAWYIHDILISKSRLDA